MTVSRSMYATCMAIPVSISNRSARASLRFSYIITAGNLLDCLLVEGTGVTLEAVFVGVAHAADVGAATASKALMMDAGNPFAMGLEVVGRHIVLHHDNVAIGDGLSASWDGENFSSIDGERRQGERKKLGEADHCEDRSKKEVMVDVRNVLDDSFLLRWEGEEGFISFTSRRLLDTDSHGQSPFPGFP